MTARKRLRDYEEDGAGPSTAKKVVFGLPSLFQLNYCTVSMLLPWMGSAPFYFWSLQGLLWSLCCPGPDGPGPHLLWSSPSRAERATDHNGGSKERDGRYGTPRQFL